MSGFICGPVLDDGVCVRSAVQSKAEKNALVFLNKNGSENKLRERTISHSRKTLCIAVACAGGHGVGPWKKVWLFIWKMIHTQNPS